MYAGYVPPFAAILRPSPVLITLLLIMMLSLGFALGEADRDLALIVSLAAAGFVWQVLRQSAILRPPFQGFRVDARGTLFLQGAGGECRVTVEPSSIALPLFVLLVVRDENSRRHRLLVWRDAIAPDFHRQLRVYVRWCRPADGGTDLN